MAVEAGFDFHELDELTKQLYKTAVEEYPKEAKKFLTKQGNKGRRVMRAEIRSRVKGHNRGRNKENKGESLNDGIDKGKVTKYEGDFQVRVYNKAKHAWLVEHGHSNVKTRTTYNGNWAKKAIPVGTPVVMVPGRGTVGPLFIGRDGAVKQIEGRYYAAATTNRLKAEFPGDAEAFVDELFEKGLEL